jgi:hypothetical protein
MRRVRQLNRPPIVCWQKEKENTVAFILAILGNVSLNSEGRVHSF